MTRRTRLAAVLVALLPSASSANPPDDAPPAPSTEAPAPVDEPPVEQAPAEQAPGEQSPGAQSQVEQPPASEEPSGGEVIVVEDKTTRAQLMERSAEAVHVIETTRARTQTADMGEVLARSQGVAVRRTAGLGSYARFSLDGLYDDQIRFFLDGIPLEIAGYPFGIVNVPVNLIDRVEVYRGVVPIRFGADALGGAVNLASSSSPGTHLSAAYQVGSFGTHRVSVAAKHADPDGGWYQAVTGFFDRAANNYRVDVEAPDDQGRLHDVTVPRFHDRYLAAGGGLQVGVTDRQWADRLEVRGFYTGYAKDLQSNLVMSLPYGEVTYGEGVAGASARYLVALPGEIRLDALVAYGYRTITFRDRSEWVYDWYGKQIRKRPTAGEIDGSAHDDLYWEHDGFARVLLAHELGPGELRFAVTSQVANRTGNDHARSSTARDPLSAQRSRLTAVGGVEWEIDPLSDAIENIAFAKSYIFHAGYEDVRPGDIFVSLRRTSATFGAGDAFRWRAKPWLYLKASYEYATRLPSTDELFGDGALVGPNPDLEPEVSHNLNLGPRIEYTDRRIGELLFDLNAFWRDSHDLIVLFPGQQTQSSQNVYDARSLGVDAAVAWTSPREHVSVDGSITYVDSRNASPLGPFGAFDGDRIPNRPYLLASFGVRGRIGDVEPYYIGRYVHSFLRGWGVLGDPRFHDEIAAQLAHDIGVTYTAKLDKTRLSTTFEIDNVTDAQLFDSFGAQRPGRAYYLKLTGDL